MSRPLVLLLLVLVVVVGGLIALASRAHEKPVQRIEKPVDVANLAG